MITTGLINIKKTKVKVNTKALFSYREAKNLKEKAESGKMFPCPGTAVALASWKAFFSSY